MIHHGDCLEILPTLPAESIDSIVTDPPYGLSFMGKNWDHGIPGEAFWSEALRVAKPGTHLLAFGGTRTFHRLTCAIEDAGWEIRDCIMWVYGSGFPKSHDVSKAIDKAAGAERKVTNTQKLTGKARVLSGANYNGGYSDKYRGSDKKYKETYDITAPATPAAQKWQGWGTALKPAWEPIIVARKPLKGTVAQNVQAYGTGAVNVDGCRVGTENIKVNGWKCSGERVYNGRQSSGFDGGTHSGRWPANLIHDGSDEVVGLFPSGSPPKLGRTGKKGGSGFGNFDDQKTAVTYGVWPPDPGGSAARFFYCAKASKADRDEGCEGLGLRRKTVAVIQTKGVACDGEWENGKQLSSPQRNHHPTVKPTDLMRYLCRLVTPPGGTVLDPFCGSGSTGKAATLEGFEFIGIEREAEYVEIARARIAHARGDMPLLEAVR